MNTSQRHGDVDPKDLCVAVACAYLMFDVAKALVAILRAQECCSLILGPPVASVRRSLYWIVLIFAFARLPWSVVEGNLRVFESEVLKGCYETSRDALQRPLILACGSFIVAVHDSVVDVHHNATAKALRSFMQYQFLVLL